MDGPVQICLKSALLGQHGARARLPIPFIWYPMGFHVKKTVLNTANLDPQVQKWALERGFE